MMPSICLAGLTRHCHCCRTSGASKQLKESASEKDKMSQQPGKVRELQRSRCSMSCLVNKQIQVSSAHCKNTNDANDMYHVLKVLIVSSISVTSLAS